MFGIYAVWHLLEIECDQDVTVRECERAIKNTSLNRVSFVAYAVNKGKSLSGIYLHPISDDAVNSVGYMGHDQILIDCDSLVRKLPIYLEEDTNANPTGGTRELHHHCIYPLCHHHYWLQ